jgi:hypothetical protein
MFSTIKVSGALGNSSERKCSIQCCAVENESVSPGECAKTGAPEARPCYQETLHSKLSKEPGQAAFKDELFDAQASRWVFAVLLLS